MSERESGEEPQRRNKTRGGKKTRRKHELFIEVAEGRHIPKARISDTPIGETGLDRSLSDNTRDAVPKPKLTTSVVSVPPPKPRFTTSVVRVPPPSAKAKAASAIASASNPASSSSAVSSVVPKPKGATGESYLSVPVPKSPAFSSPATPPAVAKVVPAPRTQESSGVVLKPTRGPPALAVREPNCSEVRLSLDFHGVVQDYSGRVSAENLAAIEDFIRDSRHNKIGICTYIGERGHHSQTRRREVASIVQDFRARTELDLRLLITSDKSKSAIDHSVHCHIDDRVDTCCGIVERGGTAILISRRVHPDLETYPSLPLALQALRTRFVPKEFTKAWPGPFTSL